MFLFVRDTFTTSDGTTYLVLYNVVRDRRWEALQQIHRDLFVVKSIVFTEAAIFMMIIFYAFSRIK